MRRRPADIGILFRSRESHREFEAALERRGVSTYVYKGLGFFDAPEIQDAVALLRFLAQPTSDLRAAAFLRSRLVRLSDDGVRRLSPRLAAAVAGPERAGGVRRPWASKIRWCWPRAHGESPAGWRRVDRITPAELLDEVLRETAYAYELRGPRRLQARENLKKLRGHRAAHSEPRLRDARADRGASRSAGGRRRIERGDRRRRCGQPDDRARGEGARVPDRLRRQHGTRHGQRFRAPIRVGFDAADEPSVAIADYQSESDDDAQAREREETKRLLYVALTRARDRLYLSATVQNGVCRMGRGSLGEVLPRSLVALLRRGRKRPLANMDCGRRPHSQLSRLRAWLRAQGSSRRPRPRRTFGDEAWRVLRP